MNPFKWFKKNRKSAAAPPQEPRIWLTSDLHFGHSKEFLWGSRGFGSSFAHDNAIVHNWNCCVRPEDTVYVLGDLMLEDNTWGMLYLGKLNGNIKIVFGNHDTDTRKQLYTTLPNVECLGYATVIRKGKRHFYLSHYPTCTGNGEEHHAPWCLCGHSHTSDRWADVGKRCYHVELDAHHYCPVLLDNIIEDLKQYKSTLSLE